jgi:hypothetical protein
MTAGPKNNNADRGPRLVPTSTSVIADRVRPVLVPVLVMPGSVVVIALFPSLRSGLVGVAFK